MRLPIALLLVVVPLVISPEVRGDNPPAGASDSKGGKLDVTIDKSKVDLQNHRLEVKMSHPAEKVRVKVIGESGATLAEVEQPFGGAAAGTALIVTWQPSSSENVTRIEVWGHDTRGFYKGVAILPWNVSIDHEEVNFQTDSDVIRASEVPKLEASFKKINEVMAKLKDTSPVTLFIGGHTDTVGAAEYNLNLSRKRARSISTWFRNRGIKVRIAYEGFGESAPLVKTADEVDEPRNRRVDYILAFEPPKLPTTPPLSWKSL